MNWIPIFLSIRLGLVTAVSLTVVAFPVAFALSKIRKSWRSLIEAFLMLPLMLPPTVLGFYILRLISPEGWIGSIYSEWTGLLLPFSFTGLVIGSVICSFPLVLQSFLGSISEIEPEVIDAAKDLGASPFQLISKVIFPLSLSGGIRGAVLTFGHTLGEFGVVMMIGGNIPGETRTASVAIYDSIQQMNSSEASKTSFFLLIVSFGVLLITRRFAMRK